jgi:2-alkyl-3-oxoalkanoate reductase
VAMRVLITGATGFIGKAMLRAAVARGWQASGACRGRPAPDSPAATWKTLAEWRAAPSSVRFDAVVHAAALRHRHGVDPSEYERTNLALTREVVELARERAGRLVEISSVAVYGWPAAAALPIDESFPAAPVNRYGASKVRCEQLVRESGLPHVIVQPSITYGPGDTNGMVDKLLRMIARRRFVAPGLGASRVQLVYVDDLTRIVLDAAQAERALGATFICTFRDPIRVRDLVRLASRAVGRWVPPVGPPRRLLRLGARAAEWADRLGFFSGEPPLTREKLATVTVDRAYRIERMRALLGTEPQVGYEEGLRRTAQALGLA